MRKKLRNLSYSILIWLCTSVAADEGKQDLETKIESLDKPLYSPFIERYIIDELKQLRSDQQNLKVEFYKELTDRQLKLAEVSATYATDTVTYFFYLIAATSSVLLLVGWNSLRDIRSNIEGHAEAKISKLIVDYEARLDQLEQNLVSKSAVIQANQAEIETTNEIQALWLRAGQESAWEQKIKIYDHILELRPESAEAMTYKADAAIEIGQPQLAIALCNKALEIEPGSGHAYFQLACAFADLKAFEIAYDYLLRAITISEDYRAQSAEEDRFLPDRKIMELLESVDAG
ncbi:MULTISPECIES: hypothetical protein [unclassified Neptuniibacter]|uniref:hypothetical protein n=1 Tax=unclassified Neptuniibacter TaxID=2630693 RepID=UPI000C6535E1|nr:MULTISPECIES: hypothetical protein [unclassified Neptuniibacter]MAY41548.1 hypothetical protein [Oceanospirillaceae bacterium]|tara:strand:- start:1572 stop:2441 length:870 start_codon:yes stop_codon:yes gene_type:complete